MKKPAGSELSELPAFTVRNDRNPSQRRLPRTRTRRSARIVLESTFGGVVAAPPVGS